jgi:hypothetical protein
MRLGRPPDGYYGYIKSPRYSRDMFIFNFNVVFICKILHMYASPVSLLRLPTPRRRVNRGKFAPAVRGRPPELLLRSGDGH